MPITVRWLVGQISEKLTATRELVCALVGYFAPNDIARIISEYVCAHPHTPYHIAFNNNKMYAASASIENARGVCWNITLEAREVPDDEDSFYWRGYKLTISHSNCIDVLDNDMDIQDVMSLGDLRCWLIEEWHRGSTRYGDPEIPRDEVEELTHKALNALQTCIVRDVEKCVRRMDGVSCVDARE